jgi:hypothetical protein
MEEKSSLALLFVLLFRLAVLLLLIMMNVAIITWRAKKAELLQATHQFLRPILAVLKVIVETI